MRGSASACMVALVLLVPTALAADSLLASSLSVAGSTSVEGDAAALFFVSDEDAVSWDLVADSATLVREYATYVAVAHPLQESYLTSNWQPWESETIDIGTLSISSGSTLIMGAMLVLAESAPALGRSEGLVTIVPAIDPTLRQDLPTNAEGGDGGHGYIEETIPGEFLNATFSEGTFTIAGELTIQLYGPAYSLSAGGSTSDMQTGEFETARTASYVEGRQERHTLTLHNAVLQVRANEPVSLFTTFPTVDVQGTMKAERPEGGLILGGVEVAAPDDGSSLTYTGAATLSLAPSAGRIAASTPTSLATAGAIAAQGPPFLAISLAAAVLVVAAIGAIVLALRRRTQADALDLALLAMEERRWEDALPLLTRLAKKEPNNAHVLLDRALCLEQVGRFEDAARAFEAALRAAPRHAEAHFYYARTLAKMREKEAARVHLEEALERDPRLVEMARTERVLHGL